MSALVREAALPAASAPFDATGIPSAAVVRAFDAMRAGEGIARADYGALVAYLAACTDEFGARPAWRTAATPTRRGVALCGYTAESFAGGDVQIPAAALVTRPPGDATPGASPRLDVVPATVTERDRRAAYDWARGLLVLLAATSAPDDGATPPGNPWAIAAGVVVVCGLAALAWHRVEVDTARVRVDARVREVAVQGQCKTESLRLRLAHARETGTLLPPAPCESAPWPDLPNAGRSPAEILADGASRGLAVGAVTAPLALGAAYVGARAVDSLNARKD